MLPSDIVISDTSLMHNSYLPLLMTIHCQYMLEMEYTVQFIPILPFKQYHNEIMIDNISHKDLKLLNSKPGNILVLRTWHTQMPEHKWCFLGRLYFILDEALGTTNTPD